MSPTPQSVFQTDSSSFKHTGHRSPQCREENSDNIKTPRIPQEKDVRKYSLFTLHPSLAITRENPKTRDTSFPLSTDAKKTETKGWSCGKNLEVTGHSEVPPHLDPRGQHINHPQPCSMPTGRCPFITVSPQSSLTFSLFSPCRSKRGGVDWIVGIQKWFQENLGRG